MENPIKMDDLGIPLFSEASIYVQCVLGMRAVILRADYIMWGHVGRVHNDD